MEPTTDNEREIARRVDELARQDNLPVTSVAGIVQSFASPLSHEEIQFLLRYVIWRRDHPISGGR